MLKPTQLWTAKLRIIFEITKKYTEITSLIYVFFGISLGFRLIYSNFAPFSDFKSKQRNK